MLARMWRKGNPLTLLVGMQSGTATLEKVWKFLRKLKIELPYNPVIALLGIYPKDTNIVIRRGTCTPNVYSSNVHNSQTMERTQMPTDR